MNRRKTFKQISSKHGWKNYYLCYCESAIGIQTPSGLWCYYYFSCGGLNELTSEDIKALLVDETVMHGAYEDYALQEKENLLQDGYTVADIDFLEDKLIELYWALCDEEHCEVKTW